MAPAALCILIPTFPAQMSVARLTAQLIEKFWEDHPAIHFCGADSDNDESWLQLRRNTNDWLGILADAVSDLRRRGVDAIYLILDDQAPVGRCHADLLNVALPNILSTSGADRIALFGPGQFEPWTGKPCTLERLQFERLDSNWPARFSLHPALWKLDSLAAHLEFIRESHGPEPVSAWLYEGIASRNVDSDPTQQQPHLRIVGDRAAHPEFRPRFLSLWPLARSAVRAMRGLLSFVGLKQKAEQLERLSHPLFKYYHGPYPYYWSGMLLRGQFQSDLGRWLRISGQNDLATLLSMELNKRQ